METTTTPPAETTAEKPVTILRMRTSNFLRIGAEGIEIVPHGSSVTLRGRNGQGKSSVIMAIWAVLTGRKNLPAVPIHTGESKSETFCDFGEFTATLKITATSGPSIKVESKGVAIRSPQEFLQKHSNEILMDLAGFLDLGKTAEGRRKQRVTLERLVGIDTTSLDADKKRHYDERTLVNRDLETMKGKLTLYPADPTAPTAEVNVSELMAQLQKIQFVGDFEIGEAQKHNDKNREARDAVARVVENEQSAVKTLQDHDAEIALVEKELAELKESRLKIVAALAVTSETITEMRKGVSALLDKDIPVLRTSLAESRKPIEVKISEADTENTKFRNNNRRSELEKQIKVKSDESDALTSKITGIDAQKQLMLSKAKFPLPELSFNEDGILLDGLPLEQGSMAKQLKAIAAIGFAFKPKIAVALIRDASLFDTQTLKEIEQMAEINQGQVWFERVAELDKDGKPIVEPMTFLIEDGTLVKEKV